MKYLLLLTIIFYGINCKNSDESVYVIKLTDKEKDEIKLNDSLAYNLDIGSSLYSQIQVSDFGILITPRSVIDGTSLFSIDIPITEKIVPVPVIRNGRGPSEMLGIEGSYFFKDTLVFFSAKSNKLIYLNDSLKIIKEKTLNSQSYILNDFAYANKKLFTDIPPKFNNNKLLRINDLRNDSVTRLIDYRIPPEYEPSIRNEFSLLGVFDEEIYYSYTGDKDLIFIDYKGNHIRRIVFGENDPIPEPYTVKNFSEIKPVQPYIIKSQQYMGYFFVLVDFELWILKKESFEFIKRIKLILDSKNKSRLPIIDFAITNNMIVLLEGRNKLHQLSFSEIRLPIE